MDPTFTNCAGIILFKGHETVLCKTYKGHYSFPKGKREKGETTLENALREFEEETGFSRDQIELYPDFSIDELSRKGNKSVRYFVATLKPEEAKRPHVFKFDPDELVEVAWHPISSVAKLEGLKDERKEVFQQVLEHFSAS